MNISVNKANELIKSYQDKISEIKEFVELAENSPTETDEQKAIKYYAYTGSVAETAKLLNEDGLRIGKRKWISNDVTAIIDQKSDDPLRKKLREMYKYRYKKAVR